MSDQPITYRDVYTSLVNVVQRESRLSEEAKKVLIANLDKHVATPAFEAKGYRVRPVDKVVKSTPNVVLTFTSKSKEEKPLSQTKTKVVGGFRWVAGKKVKAPVKNKTVDLSNGKNPAVITRKKK